MKENYIGERIKKLRKEVLKCNQNELAEKLNRYEKENSFNQPLLAKIENGTNSNFQRIVTIINYLYSTFAINPNWIIIENNTNHSKYINISIEKNITEIIQLAKNKTKDITEYLNSIELLTLNPPYDLLYSELDDELLKNEIIENT